VEQINKRLWWCQKAFFEVIEACVDHPIKNIKKEACWALSNVVAGTRDHLKEFFKSESLVKKVIELSAEHGDINVRKEAGWCLSNAICTASFEQIGFLVNAGFINAMTRLLESKIERVAMMAMDSLRICLVSYNIHFQKGEFELNPFIVKMEEANGVDILEEIQAVEELSDACCRKAAAFVTDFWPENGDESTDENNDMEEDNNEQTGHANNYFDEDHNNKPDNQPFQF